MYESADAKGPGSALRILKFQSNLFEEICMIESSSFSHPFPRRYIAELSTLYPETFLVAEEDSEVLGYVVAQMDHHQAHVLSIAVREDHRRRRVGSRLMHVLLKTLKMNGIESVLLEVRDSNSAAKAFYEKLGFQLVARLRGYYENGEDAASYSLRL
jgi:ribosomal-protein-alanine N-acetyltransferase